MSNLEGRKEGTGYGAKQPPLKVNVPWGGGLKSSILGGGVFECTFHGICRVLKEGQHLFRPTYLHFVQTSSFPTGGRQKKGGKQEIRGLSTLHYIFPRRRDFFAAFALASGGEEREYLMHASSSPSSFLFSSLPLSNIFFWEMDGRGSLLFFAFLLSHSLYGENKYMRGGLVLHPISARH